MFKARVCHLTSVHRYDDTRIYHKECHSLAKAGYETHLVAANAPNGIKDGIHLHGIDFNQTNRFNRMTMLVRAIYLKAREIDAQLYHIHDPELIPASIFLKLAGKKIIYDVHEDVPQQILSKDYLADYRLWVSTAFQLFEKFSVKLFNFIIPATEPIAQRFMLLSDNVMSVKNYAIFQNLNHLSHKRYNNTDKLKIIFVGSIYSERGIEEVMQALNMLPHVPLEFKLYGRGEEDYLSRLKAMDKLGRLEYLGYLPSLNVINKIAEFDIGFIYDHPLKRHMEGLPVKLFEYMAAGVPIIAPDYPYWKEIIEGNNCGLCIKPRDPKAFANAVEYLNDPEIRELMGENGRKAIINKYNWEKESQKLLSIYEAILGQSSIPPFSGCRNKPIE
jgi:glycosyltransferase involved in cell wall biosynthesis